MQFSYPSQDITVAGLVVSSQTFLNALISMLIQKCMAYFVTFLKNIEIKLFLLLCGYLFHLENDALEISVCFTLSFASFFIFTA